jgi:hypothetical protein
LKLKIDKLMRKKKHVKGPGKMLLSREGCIHRTLIGGMMIMCCFSSPTLKVRMYAQGQPQRQRKRQRQLRSQMYLGLQQKQQQQVTRERNVYSREMEELQRQSLIFRASLLTITERDSALLHHIDPPKPRNVSISDNYEPISELPTNHYFILLNLSYRKNKIDVF